MADGTWYQIRGNTRSNRNIRIKFYFAYARETGFRLLFDFNTGALKFNSNSAFDQIFCITFHVQVTREFYFFCGFRRFLAKSEKYIPAEKNISAKINSRVNTKTFFSTYQSSIKNFTCTDNFSTPTQLQPSTAELNIEVIIERIVFQSNITSSRSYFSCVRQMFTVSRRKRIVIAQKVLFSIRFSIQRLICLPQRLSFSVIFR